MLASPQTTGRGSALLLAHCSAVARLDATRPRAFERLEDEVGGDLARLLVSALAAPVRGNRRVA